MLKYPTFLLIICFFASLTPSLSLNISLNSSLSTSTPPNQAWTSPNSTFSLRFLPLSTATNTFSLSITYDSTPIWSAPATAPVTAGATFRLHSSGDLQLTSSTGTLLWRSNTSNLGITHATLDDTGNFMLMNMSNHVIWSTFDNPTDTIVPSQNFTLGMVLTSGSYSFFLNSSGNLTLRWRNDISSTVYYSAGLNSSVIANLSDHPWLGLQQIGILSLYDANLTTSVIMAYGSDYAEPGDILRFLRLDNDGNLRIYSTVRGSGTDVVRWSAVSDQCEVFGYCGNMGICSYNDTGPICGCPSENFDPVDVNDSRKGCKLNKETKDCPGSVAMLQMDHTKFLMNPSGAGVFYVGITACSTNCLIGACIASTDLADGSGHCTIQNSGFVSGYQSPALPSTSFVKVCGPAAPNPPPAATVETKEHERLKGWVIAVAVLCTLVALALLEGSIWWWCCRKNPKFGSLSAQYALLEYASGAPVQFTYRELHQATRGFKEKLGEGGFGAVYKGILANKTAAAVKRLEGIEQGEKQFRMEVATISSTHHLNLVRLIGFCSEGRHRLLVYEFMKNSSLDSFLFASETGSEKFLSWESRFNIALGTARGITYLHEECRDCIVHCDIKPENILLDDNYDAKVSDFGLAKLVNPKDHRYRTLASVRGTRGYLAPEWLANLPITSKSDIYSFGMVLLELVSGRRNFEVSADTNMKKFSVWAYEEFDKGNVGSIIDRRLANSEVDMDQVARAIRVSFWCIQEQPFQRPMMGKVVQMLEGILEIGEPPAHKAAADGSISGVSLNMSSNVNAFSSFAIAGPDPSSSSSFQAQRAPSSYAGINMERPTSTLIYKET